jgi:broad specificity phosphatase PhoE
MASTRMLVVRHGQSVWNAEGRWQGHADPPLSALGVLQAKSAAAALGALDAIVASDLTRAIQTAGTIAGELGFGPVETDARLREVDAGEWTGLTRDEIEVAWPGFLAEHRRPPAFESWEHVAGRAAQALRDLARRHPGGEVLVVSHSGVVRSLERHLAVAGPILANLAGTWFEVDGEAISVGERVLLVDEHDVHVTKPRQL